MTFDQWIDAVNAEVRGRLGDHVRTEELSWDSAMWVSSAGTAVAALETDEATATVSFDGGDKLSFAFSKVEANPETVGGTIAARLASRTA